MNRLFKSTLLAAALVVFGPQVGKVFASNLHPPKFVRGKLVCAKNINLFLKHIGKHGTNSNSAQSFLKLQRVSIPRAGDVAVNRRPGGWHSQIVDGIKRGIAMCWNPGSKIQKWAYQSCNASWPRVKKIYLRSF
jgi:hypothetical protein